MGLDIYFHRIPRKAWESYKREQESFDSLTAEQRRGRQHPHLGDTDDCGYFRKVNFLLPFFGYEGDCEYMEVTRERMTDLERICRDVLADRGSAGALLPTQAGFFFGSTDYDELYYGDVARVADWSHGIAEGTDWEQDAVLMYCWW